MIDDSNNWGEMIDDCNNNWGKWYMILMIIEGNDRWF